MWRSSTTQGQVQTGRISTWHPAILAIPILKRVMGRLAYHLSALGRRYFTLLVKACLFLFLLSFLWLQIRIASFKSPELDSSSQAKDDFFFAKMNLSAINPNGSRSLPSSLPQLRHLVQEANSRQRVLNEELFPPLAPDDTVIVVQVHKRVHYLYALIESLRQAQNIENTLLIFSHDLYNSDINALVETIDFCKVGRTKQLYIWEDPNDCPRDINKIEAAKLGCNNAAHPDLYGHYREASFTQTKHHWWWKGSQHVLFHQVNRVMDGLEVTHNHTGPVIFLEEDHYVSPDFLPFLAAMMDLRASHCPECAIMCLGSYTKTINYPEFSHRQLSVGQVEKTKWQSSKHNMGMVFDRHLWTAIRSCASSFCTFDDYNWDWSLQHVSSACLPRPLVTLAPLAPRVFHIGECGIHHKGKDCSSSAIIQRVFQTLEAAESHLFPSTLTLRQSFPRHFRLPKGNGGWGDIRDHQLCLRHLVSTPS
ncbi:MGAT2 [Cordylochernes scorpioides]|uniref:Alpha-1,6-mannosyl-glycoprotein 2-beta-N-acetylglucosaminyltransferase n=1 Tax=Cordylochernes scorpioides TaxID=51811 RepID=A0ABY6KWG0_9ARAC|nr:MGAT2 [Cordylochernes scorpioides]